MTVADEPGAGSCPICAKHRGEGPLVGPAELAGLCARLRSYLDPAGQ
ncbi:MAG TPA: hypothetical protein VFM55_21205 [Micromonosporaceae bacterium]|nr:hypothetical protein [Micromonosporaceae bacterium]